MTDAPMIDRTLAEDDEAGSACAAQHPAAIEFVERMGLLAQGDGLPRIAGRLMGLMVLHGGPLAFGDLAERLQVSRGSVSTNVRLLEGMGVLERVTKPGERGDFFRLADDPYGRLIEGVRQRAAKGASLAASTREAMSERLDARARERLEALGSFYGTLAEVVQRVGDGQAPKPH